MAIPLWMDCPNYTGPSEKDEEFDGCWSCKSGWHFERNGFDIECRPTCERLKKALGMVEK